MKQRITVDQLNQLAPERQEILREQWNPHMGDWYYYPKIKHSDVISTSLIIDLKGIKEDRYPLLNIGQMIEFLEQKVYCVDIRKINRPTHKMENTCIHTWGFDNSEDAKQYWSVETCDALWEAVKETL